MYIFYIHIIHLSLYGISRSVYNYNVKQMKKKIEFSYDTVGILYEDVMRENSTHNL